MNGLLKKQVNESPLKKKFIADQLKIKPSQLSQVLSGARFLEPAQEVQLKEILKMVS